MSISIADLRQYVIKPVLYQLGMWSQAAENLLVGTALHESNLQHLDQITPGPGPAYGIYQMEKPTHDDIWINYLEYKGDLYDKVSDFALSGAFHDIVNGKTIPSVAQLHGNMYYATVMCRIHYLRVPERLPAERDFVGMAVYWKRHYNTALGKGKIDTAAKAFEVACSDY